LFSPNPVPPTYAEFPASLSLRVAIRAAGEDGMTLRDYGEIRAPVGIVAGTDGKAVDYRGHSACLHHDIRGCTYRPHGASQLHQGVVEAIEEVHPQARRGNVVLVIGAK
jgi:hypothetical protein